MLLYLYQCNICYCRLSRPRDGFTGMAAQMQPARIENKDSVFKQRYQDGFSWALQGDMSALSDTIIVEYVWGNI